MQQRQQGRRPALIAAVVVTTGLVNACLFALLTPLGLPYDEPAHWANVQYYYAYGRLPVLGEPYVYYEGQQAPLYYAGSAIAMRVFEWTRGDGLLIARLIGVLGFAVMLAAVWGILRALAPNRPAVAHCGTAALALNPMLGAMAGSAQNDTWALGWAFLALWLVAARPNANPVAVGAVSAFAVLTKVSVLPIILVALVGHHLLQKSTKRSLIAAGLVMVPTAAWVIRNKLLYGDFTGQAGVIRTGAEFTNVHLTPFELARSVATYLTTPTEYFRNTLVSPAVADAAAILLILLTVIGVGSLIRSRRVLHRPALILVVASAIVSLLSWYGEHLIGWPVAFRTAYGVLPGFAAAIGALNLGRSRAGAVAVTLALMINAALLIWVLASLPSLPSYPSLPIKS